MKWTVLLVLFIHQLQGQNENSILWEITRSDLSDTSYILGTIHVPQSKFFYVNEKLPEVKRKVEAAYFELLDDPEAVKSVLWRMMAEDGESIKELVSKKEYRKIKKFFRKNDFKNLLILNKVKPMLLSQVALQSMIKGDTANAMDILMQDEMISLGKEVFALETYEDQLSVLLSASVKEQADELVKIIFNPDSVKLELDLLTKMYLAQDLTVLDSLLKSSDTLNGVSLEELNSKRNFKMVPKIEVAMKKHSVLIAVGFAHLAGEKGILELLRLNGYQIRALN